MLKPACAVLFVATLALPAFAAESGWSAWKGHDAAAPGVIFTAGSEAPGAVLICKKDGALGAFLALDPGDISKTLAKQAPYSRSVDGALSIDGAEPLDARLRFVPAIKVVESREHRVAARVFNAAVDGEPFSLNVKMDRGETRAVTYSLPAPDATFDAFAKHCETVRAGAK